MKTLGDRPLTQVARRVTGQFYVDRDRDHRNTVFLAGSGRSGTTWVADIINHANDYRYIFEPFHRHKVGMCRNFRYRQYVRPEDSDPKFLEPARRIVTGRVRNLWTDKYNRKRVSDKRLVKDVRANLLLKWMHVNFNGMPIVLLLRHPCAVVNSRMRVDWSGGAELRQFLVQPDLVHDYLQPFRSKLAAAEDPFERMVYFWCIETLVPLQQFRPGEIHVMFYERLCLDPEAEIARLFSFLGRGFDSEAMKAVARPSSATRADSAVVAGGDLIGGWRRQLAPEQTTRALEIVESFGLTRIYSSDPEPRLRNPDDALG